MRGSRRLRPETFEFLGFKHVCGVDRRGRFGCLRTGTGRGANSSITSR
jgi:hypothetical protein